MINISESSNYFTILIISFISSFKINKVNHFPAFTAPFPLNFLSNLFIAFELKLLTNLGKLSLAKGIAIFVSTFFPKLSNQEPKDPPNSIIFYIWVLLILISVDLLLAKVFLILVVSLVVKNKSCGNSSSSNFFYLILILLHFFVFCSRF